jgi:hypothetical protein
MCGIVGYVGKQKAASLIIEGLKRLEYRGYDSAGIAIFQQGGHFEVAKKAGRAAEFGKGGGRHIASPAPTASATRAGPRMAASPTPMPTPTSAATGKIALIHNGVIENYLSMKKFLTWQGLHLQVRDRHRGALQPDRLPLCEGAGRRRRQPLPGKRPQDPAACRGHLRHRGHVPRPARRTGGRPQGLARSSSASATAKTSWPATSRHRQPDPERRVPQGRRAGLRHAGEHCDLHPRRGRCRSRWWIRSPGPSPMRSSTAHAHFMEKEIFEQPSRWKTRCAAGSPRTAAPRSSAD